MHVLELGQNLSALGHGVHIISRRVRSSEPASEEIGGVTVHRVYRWILRPERKSSFTASSSEINKSKIVDQIYYAYLVTLFSAYVCLVSVWIINKYKLDLVIERETSFGAGALASLLTGKPMILEIIGPRYSKLSAVHSKTIFYYTESMLRDWVDREKCVSVPAGVNLSLFHKDDLMRQSCRAKLGFGSKDMVLGYVGTFQTWHGIETLLTTLQSLQTKVPSVRSLMVGPSYETYETMARKMGVDQLCKFTGPVDYQEVPAYINACDVMLALYDPSRDPIRKKYGIGWPIKILEYMACGKPVISTKVEPIDRIIVDESFGSLVEPGRPAELAETIEELLANPHKLGQMGAKGKALVESRYSWSAVAKMMSSYL